MPFTKVTDNLLSSGVGTGANNLIELDSSGNLPAVDGSAVTTLTSGNLTGALPAIDGANLTAIPVVTEAMIHSDAVNKFVSGRKNLILNGDFKISQRGDYTSATPLSSAWIYYLDRFKFRLNVISGTLTHKEDQAVDSGIVDSIKLVATSTGSGYINALQMVEDIGLLKGRVVTISAWVKSDNSNAKLVVNMDGANVQFNSSLHTGGGSWELLKGTYTVPTSITTFNIYCGILANVTGNVPITSGDFVEITQVQLELGNQATDFEHRSYGEELALCQRYFETSFPIGVTPANGSTTTSLLTGYSTGIASNRSQAGALVQFKTTKRVVPTMTQYGTSNGNLGYKNIADATDFAYDQTNVSIGGTHTQEGFKLTQGWHNGSSHYIQVHYTADAEL